MIGSCIWERYGLETPATPLPYELQSLLSGNLLCLRGKVTLRSPKAFKVSDIRIKRKKKHAVPFEKFPALRKTIIYIEDGTYFLQRNE